MVAMETPAQKRINQNREATPFWVGKGVTQQHGWFRIILGCILCVSAGRVVRFCRFWLVRKAVREPIREGPTLLVWFGPDSSLVQFLCCHNGSNNAELQARPLRSVLLPLPAPYTHTHRGQRSC